MSKEMNTRRILCGKKALKAILTLVLACSFVLLIGGICGVGKIKAAGNSVTFQTAADFTEYSQAYFSNTTYKGQLTDPDDTLIFSYLGSESALTNDGFISIGTSGRPFSGTLQIPATGTDTFELFNCALFDYVTTDLKITGTGTVKIIRAAASETPAENVQTSGALFANHVVNGDDPANWNINLYDYSGSNEQAASFGGLIGDIAASASVTVNFTNTSPMNVSGGGNVGYICGTLGAGATLNVTTAGSHSDISVTSSGGHAGGLVGEMGTGAKLKFDSDNYTHVTSVTTNANNKYAGGIVGYVTEVNNADNFSFKAGVTDYAVSGSVTGKEGAGGLFGYYKNSIASGTFTLAGTYSIASGMNISSTGSTGGVFGVLENTGASFTFNGNTSGSETFNVNLSGGSNRGGVCGKYDTNALTNTFEITNTSPTIRGTSGGDSGGLIGRVSNNPAYIVIPTTTVTVQSGSLGGGLIGTVGEGGTFVDVSGTTTISGNCHAGLIRTMTEGVLRIKGITDLSGFTANAASSGQIVRTRGRALIYALGDGKGTNGNWTLKRNLSNANDDVFSWGQVLRVDGTILTEGDLFTVDVASAHTVTVKSPVKAMGTVTDFAKTALNIQLGTAAGKGALQFDSPNQASTLLDEDLSLTADISLAGTGITGLTRDNGYNAAFTGTFDGNNHMITFATGEKYGLKGNGSALDADSKQGNIYNHEYNGLFAKTNDASFEDLTLSGNFMIHQKSSTDANKTEVKMKLGGLSAFSTGELSIDNVTADFTLDFMTEVDYIFRFGGAVGEANGTGLELTVTDSSFLPVVTDRSAVDITGNTNPSYMGGVIGYVSADSTQSISITDSTIGMDYEKTNKNARRSCFGSAIARIENKEYVKNNRTVLLDNVTIDITADGAVGGNSKFSGILGAEWFSADVTIGNSGGITVSNASLTANSSADFGGLVHTATGYWNVKSLALTSTNFNVPGGTFGFIANKTWTSENGADTALYLDVDNTGTNYNIAALTFTGTPSFTVYDEIVANSRFNSNDITNNGNSVISITTSGNVINTSGSANTYQNKTTYGDNNNSINPNTRYYYNIAHARANTATAKYNFLVFSVNKYAHPSLSSWFTPTGSTFTGSLDMTGLSYYPIDLTTGVTFNNATLKLDNNLMETWVHATDDDDNTRSTRADDNQHYLMHTAAFRNVTSGISFSGTNIIQGNVPKMSDSFCGFVVAGKFGGNETGDPTVFSASDVTFDGAFITNKDNNNPYSDTTYAPLFINKIGKRTNVSITGAKQSTTAYSSFAGNSQYAASSLIGDVGDASARTITLTFSDLRFDGRSSAASIGNMDTTYGTTKSIFSRATILNSFMYAGECTGTYNYEDTEDWTDSTTAIHHVTYGKEIKTSVENSNKQKKYYSSTVYTHPTSYPSASEYDFSEGFLPYVYVGYNLSEFKHELSVNVTYSSVIEGFGKYDKPYIIDSGDKLNIISRIIKGDDVGSTVEINLPGDLTTFNHTSTGYGEYLYNFGASTFVSSNGGSDQTNSNVRKYLAGAYYVIDGIDENTLQHIDITLPSDYEPLGQTTSSNPEYAFRGVIIGGSEGTKKIINKSPNPLVYTSHGCVIKDLTVEVDVDVSSSNDISLAAPTGSATYDYSGGVQTYGAVIGKIFGGDTIIDNVQVTFTDVEFIITGNETTTFTRLVPIGGYVGTLVNGGLIFRNMTASNVGLTNSVCNKINNAGYLYVNPIIGRVIAGYAFHETSTYAVTSASIPNGTKNYTIPDLSLSAGKLNITNSSNTYTITVPDGQAMYILGAIVNSGAASASYHASTEQAYDALSGFWQAYREHTTVRGGSGYSTVGTATGDDYTAACNDKYTSDRAKVPYIIRAYSNKTGNVYFARTISTRDNNIINITGDCDVAAGFRGIGSIYLDNNLVRLRISQMNGNSNGSSHNITLNMDYREYDHKSVSSYIATANTAGLGLFNITTMKSPSGTNSVNNFALDGSIFYDVYVASTGAQSQYLYGAYVNDRFETQSPRSDNVNNINKLTYLSVGGVFGYSTTPYYIKNVTFSDFSVEGAKTAGGLIGYSRQKDNNISYIKYDSGVDNNGYVNVVGGLQAGGLIGRIFDTKTEIIGDSSGFTDLIIKNIEMKSQTPNEIGLTYFANKITGVGGIVGSVWNSRGGDGVEGNEQDDKYSISPKTRRLFITNINITKGINAANISVRNNSSSDMQFNSAGGFIGLCHSILVHIYDCKLTDVNVSANTAGGLIGRVTQHFYIHVHNVTIDGNNKNSSITGTRFAGGAIGWMTARDNWYFEFDGVVVNNYNVISESTSNNICAAGGVIGFAEGDSKPVTGAENRVCELDNITVSGCLIKTNYSDGSGKVHNLSNNTLGITARDHCGTGGIIGAVTLGVVYEEHNEFGNSYNKTSNGNNKFRLSGYNILVDSTTLTHLSGGLSNQSTSADNRKIGEIIGNNAASSTIRFVGVSEKFTNEITFCGKHVGYYNNDNENFGSDGSAFGTGGGYIVFADYNTVQTNETFSGIEDTTTNNDNYTNVTSASPFVTANPSITIGGKLITGDGVAADVASLPIQTIISNLTDVDSNEVPITGNDKYKYSAAAYYTGSSGNTNLAAFNSYLSKLVLFQSSDTGYTDTDYPGTNFPVLLLESTDSTVSHTQINSYLRLLTNTRFDFGADNATVYDIEIYNMAYSGGTFTPSASGESLQRKNGKFYMLNTAFDTGKTNPQFSLIDVRFYDPADSSKVAYHLYVPVFVKKVLSYKFDIELLSGTTYLNSVYASAPEALIENVGTPVTAYFRYTYSRTAEEWEAAINAGDSVHRNYAKTLRFLTETGGASFNNNTLLVLVDPNDGGKAYYATWATAFSNGTLDLGAFHVNKDGTGAAFTPKNLEDMLTINANVDASGNLVRCSKNDASVLVVVGEYGYRLITDADLEADPSITRYSVSVAPKNMVLDINGAYVSCLSGDTGAINVGGQYYKPASEAEIGNSNIEKYSALTESYYLSIFTEYENIFNYYTVTCPDKFSDRDFPSEKITASGESKRLIMGSIFSHTGFDISSASAPTTGPVMTDANDQLIITMSVDIGLSDTLSHIPVQGGGTSNIVGDMKSYLRQEKVKVYQDFLVYLTRNDSGVITKAIIGNPTASGTYYFDTDDEHRATYGTTGESVANVTQNFAEFITEDISAKLGYGENNDINSFTINAEVTLDYNAEAIPAQFPGHIDTDENGVTVSGSSNIGFTQSTTTYSKNTVGADETPAIKYYSEAEPEVATLDVNPIGDKVGDFSPLGINAKNNNDATLMNIDLLAVLNTTPIISQIGEYDHASILIKLYQKQEDGSYGSPLNAPTYIESMKVGDNTVAFNNNVDVMAYYYTTPGERANLVDDGASITFPELHFVVKTGSVFETAGLKYGNYRISIEVALYDSSGYRYPTSVAHNYVIYTNAKVIPEYITES